MCHNILSSRWLDRSVAGELGDSLGSFTDCVLGQLTGQKESDCGLDLSGRQSLLLVVSNQFRGLAADLLEQVVDKAVHDGHRSLGDTGFGMHLLEHSVDVHTVSLGTVLGCDFPCRFLGHGVLGCILGTLVG